MTNKHQSKYIDKLSKCNLRLSPKNRVKLSTPLFFSINLLNKIHYVKKINKIFTHSIINKSLGIISFHNKFIVVGKTKLVIVSLFFREFLF